eukprot:396686_1
MALAEPTQVNQLLLLFAAFASFTSFISPNKSLHDAIYINTIYINAIKKLKLKERQQIDGNNNGFEPYIQAILLKLEDEEHNDDVDDNNNEEKSPLQWFTYAIYSNK